MSEVSRRGFFKMAGALAIALGWPTSGLDDVAQALELLAAGSVPLIWLQGQSCSGCSVSFLDAAYPDPARVITHYASVEYHSTLSAASGELALKALEQRLAAADYLLVVEGSVPLGMAQACRVGEESMADMSVRAAKGAKAVVALGTCAAFGGIPAAPPNPTGAAAVSKLLADNHIITPLINLPGCPAHPDWLVGTLVHFLRYGPPTLNAQGCPEMFYRTSIHDHCPQFYNYDAEKFAQFFGDEGCLFKLGCLGVRTFADCSTRRWNNKTSWCVEAGAPCIGCAQPEFALAQDFPFYRIRERSGEGEAQ